MWSIDTASNPFNYKGGDVKIKVKYKGEEMEGMVATQVMVLASPVWNKFLFPPWSTESSKIKEIDFSEDDGEAILILLNIAHLQLRCVPKELDYKVLYRIAILCEQYDCHNLVEPWLDSWAKDEYKSVNWTGQEEWIYIDWAFGRNKLFDRRVERLVRTLTIDSEGKPSILTSRAFPAVMPDKLLDSVMAVREAAIQNTLGTIYHESDKYMYGKKTLCKCSRDQEACDAASYGGFILALGRNELWPPISAKDYKSPVYQLITTIASMEIAPYQGPAGRLPREDHSKCGAISSKEWWIYCLLIAGPGAVLDCHIRHMNMRNGTMEKSDGQTPRCARCNTIHDHNSNCPPNPRKRTAE